MLASGTGVRSILTPFLYAGLCLLMRRAEKTPVRSRSLPLIIGALLYTAAVTLAVYERAAAEFTGFLFRAGTLVILLAGTFLLSYHTLRLLTALLSDGRAERLLRGDGAQTAGPKTAFFRRHLLPVSFAVCLVCYLPWYLYSWPGIFSPDPVNQVEQVLGLVPLSNHHPIAHTVLIGLWMRIAGLFTADLTTAVGVYTFFQMTLFAFSAAFVVFTMDRVFGLRPAVCLCVLAFYALLPFMPVFSILVCKDTVFASVLMLFCCEIARFLRFGLPRFTPAGILHDAVFVLLGILVCLLRTNGWYAFWLFAVCFVFVFRRKLQRALPPVIAIFVAAALIRGPLMDAAGVIKPDTVESLHIPMQQIAQVLAYGRALPDEDRAMIEAVTDTTWVSELYVPGFADNIKELIRAGHPEVIEADKAGYLKLWIRIGLRYPGDYISAWAAQIRGVTWPDVPAEVAVIEGVYPNTIGLEYRPLIGGAVLVKLRELIMKLGGFVPLYGLLWSMGFWAWVLLFSGVLILTQGKGRRRLLLLVPAGALIATLLIATPISDDFRYAFPFITLAPFNLCTMTISLFANANLCYNEKSADSTDKIDR
ncbi:MAG: DUF6020 family protein [Lachnospiraceae bacterium]|nr:DUF6020 family protein [Lachnospiraceae bacterium]